MRLIFTGLCSLVFGLALCHRTDAAPITYQYRVHLTQVSANTEGYPVVPGDTLTGTFIVDDATDIDPFPFSAFYIPGGGGTADFGNGLVFNFTDGYLGLDDGGLIGGDRVLGAADGSSPHPTFFHGGFLFTLEQQIDFNFNAVGGLIGDGLPTVFPLADFDFINFYSFDALTVGGVKRFAVSGPLTELRRVREQSVPEPGALLLLVSGVAGLFAKARTHRRHP